MKLTIATAQFAVSADPARNADAIVDAIAGAAAAGARVVHFCEGALSGYAPHDLPSYAGYPWGRLRAAAERVAAAAGARRIWALVGSAHPLAAGDGAGPRPHNAIYVIDDRGALVDRYDKRFCAGDEVDGELALYSPGDHPVVVDIDGVRCGLMICHEYRYPELYRDYKARGVELIFHSFHAAGLSEGAYAAMEAEVGADHFADNWGRTLPAITMPATLVATAAANHLWISAANSSAPRACWPGLLVRPDGVIVGRLEDERAGLLIREIDTEAPLYESTRLWRGRAMAGRLHSGELVDAPRSRDRRSF